MQSRRGLGRQLCPGTKAQAAAELPMEGVERPSGGRTFPEAPWGRHTDPYSPSFRVPALLTWVC